VNSQQTRPARASGEFAIGGDLPVVRLGYGSMQIPGPGVWGEPRDHDEVIRVLRRALELGVTFIPGTSTVAHLEENVAAAAIELTPDQMQQLNEAI
jgi:aryl-alcohol dehydrogenase-like predicted oxidoreductase